MRYFYISIWLCLLLSLSSCITPLQLETLGVILTRGIDSTEDDEIETNMAVLLFEKDAPSTTRTISGTGKTVKGAVDDASKKANQELVVGKINLEIYGNELAKKGVAPYLDNLRRDANIPNTLLLAVSETKAKDIFNVQEVTIDTNLGQFLHGILQPGKEERLFPAIPLPKFTYAIKNPGLEPVLPIMGMREGVPTLSGLALFKDDKMVGQLPLDDSILYKFIEGTVHGDYFEVTLPVEQLNPYLLKKNQNEKRNVNIIFIVEKGSADTVLTNKENLKFDTNATITLNLQEISQTYRLDDEKAIQHLEREIERHVKKRFEDILAKLKELNTDAFGYGVLYRIHNKDGKLSKEEWNKLFPMIDVDFNVNVKIIRHGEVHK